MQRKKKYRDETDWRDLRRNPSKLFGYSYVYFLATITTIGLLYLSNLTAIGKNSVVPLAVTDSAAPANDFPRVAPKRIPPVSVMTAGVTSPPAVQRGKELFKANCASCHGDDGSGNGPAALTLNPKPRNFLSLAGWKNGSNVSAIYRTLQEGIAGTGMASFNYLPPADRFALIHFVRSLAPGQPMDTPEELAQLDTQYALSRGMDVSGSVPIRTAERLLLRENEKSDALVDSVAGRIMSGSGPQEILFQRIVRDPHRAVETLRQAGTSGTETFVAMMIHDPARHGFRAEVGRLTKEDWSLLRRLAADIARETGG